MRSNSDEVEKNNDCLRVYTSPPPATEPYLAEKPLKGSDYMVYGAINEKGEKYYTDLKKVFDAINDKQKEYNWLITDCVCYPNNQEIQELLNKEYCWLSGEELTKIVNHEDFQWIWAVLSGFDKSVELSEVLKYDLPYADGYTGFWKKPLALQHPLSKIEIVPWDGSLTLVLSEEKEIVDSFMESFPYSERLEDYIDK